MSAEAIRARLDRMDPDRYSNYLDLNNALRAVLDECAAAKRDVRYPGLASAFVIERVIAEKLGVPA